VREKAAFWAYVTAPLQPFSATSAWIEKRSLCPLAFVLPELAADSILASNVPRFAPAVDVFVAD
jgi:hypothetical protein